MHYADTSVLVAAVLNERHSSAARNWMLAQATGSIAVSRWTVAEFSAALSVKLRGKEIDLEQRNHALGLFTRWTRDSLRLLDVDTADCLGAARLADQHTTGLRAGDALHLGIAANRGYSMCTLDKGLAKAGRILGVNMELLP